MMSMNELMLRFPMSIWCSDGKWYGYAWHNDAIVKAGPHNEPEIVARAIVCKIHTTDVMANDRG